MFVLIKQINQSIMRRQLIGLLAIASILFTACSGDDTATVVIDEPQTYRPNLGITIKHHPGVGEDNIRIYKYNNDSHRFEIQNTTFFNSVRLAQASIKIGDSIRISTVAIDLSVSNIYQMGYELSYRQATGNQELVYWNSPIINSPVFTSGMPPYGWAYIDFKVPASPPN